MNKRMPWRIAACLGMAVGLPHVADAQVYQCHQPDGSTSFQGTPCASGAKAPVVPKAGTTTRKAAANTDTAPYDDPYAKKQWTIPAAPAQVHAPSGQSTQTPPASSQRAAPHPAGDPQLAENKRTEAQNAQSRCNAARQQLGAMKSGRPVYRTDNNGDRHYVEDADRAKETATAQQDVAAACN